MKRLIPTALGLFTTFSALPALAADKPADVKTHAYRDSLTQEQLRADTTRVKAELAALMEEYGSYRVAAPEMERLKEVAGGLEQLQDREMREVVQMLREASRLESPDSAKSKVSQAAAGQKNIQTRLRELADRLAQQKAQSAMRQRLEALALRQAANVRETQRAADSGSTPKDLKWEVREATAAAQIEQKALTAEISLVEQSLKYLADNQDPVQAKAFADAAEKADEARLADHAQEANKQMEGNFHQAADAERKVLEGLKSTLAALDAARTKEERSRELGEKLDQLADKQKQLTAATTRAWSNNQDEIRKEQGSITDQADLANAMLQRLNNDAASKVEEARQTSDNVVKDLNQRGLLDKADAVAHATDGQNTVAEKLAAAGEIMKKEAAELAKNNPSSQGQDTGRQDPNATQDPQQSADTAAAMEKIQDIGEKLQNAGQQLEMANRQLSQKGDKNDAGQRMDRANQQLQQASAEAQAMGATLSEKVGEHISKAIQQNSESRKGVGQGSQEEQEQARWKLDEAEREVDRALADLQGSANQMAQQQQSKGQKGRPSPDNRNPAPPTPDEKSDTSEANGQLAIGGGRDSGQREALSLLKQEKAPPQYEEKVRQYIQNLAKGQLPAK